MALGSNLGSACPSWQQEGHAVPFWLLKTEATPWQVNMVECHASIHFHVESGITLFLDPIAKFCFWFAWEPTPYLGEDSENFSSVKQKNSVFLPWGHKLQSVLISTNWVAQKFWAVQATVLLQVYMYWHLPSTFSISLTSLILCSVHSCWGLEWSLLLK